MSKRFISLAGSFIIGCMSGYIVTRYIYTKKMHEEIDAIRESYISHYKKDDLKKERDSETIKQEYDKKVYSLSYDTTSKDEPEEINVAPIEPTEFPYYITPEQFADEHSEFAKQTLVYYEENGVLINEEEECVDIDSNVGADIVNHFGDYEKDAAFVRNEALGIDYEVLVEHASFYGGE